MATEGNSAAVESPDPGLAADGRSLPYLGFAIVVIIYLAIIQLGGVLVTSLGDVDKETAMQTARGVLLVMCVPIGAALLFTYGVVAALGWWRPVLRDDRPVRRWVILVPIVLVVGIALGIDYADLAQKDVTFILLLLLATQLVGWGEEGMFRGIGVTTLRRHGLREGHVALWSSLIFGAVHLSNALSTGFKSVPQAIMVSLAGYFFYLIRRSTSYNAVNSVLHGLFDFSLLTGTVILAGQGGYVGTFAPVLIYPILAIVLLSRRRNIELTPTANRHVRADP